MSKKIGIIGIGSMGKMLLDGFIKTISVDPEQVFVSTRSRDKLALLKKEYANINFCENNSQVVHSSDLLFICVKPMEVSQIFDEIKDSLDESKHVVSIAACVTFKDMERKFGGKISRIVPSLTSVVFEGISLISHNNMVTKPDQEYLENLLGKMSTVKKIHEKDFEIAGDLTSCAPGLIAAIFNEFVNAALPFGSLSEKEATEMVIKTLYGTAKLIHETNMSFTETLDRVATKGGITEEGAKILQRKLPDVFREVFDKTLKKHEAIKAKMSGLFD